MESSLPDTVENCRPLFGPLRPARARIERALVSLLLGANTPLPIAGPDLLVLMRASAHAG